MELREIVNRPDNIPVDEKEMVYVVEQYIHIRKQVKVNVQPGRQVFGGQVFVTQNSYMQDISKLVAAHAYACTWLRNNGYGN